MATACERRRRRRLISAKILLDVSSMFEETLIDYYAGQRDDMLTFWEAHTGLTRYVGVLSSSQIEVVSRSPY